jgi:hypothetical protein
MKCPHCRTDNLDKARFCKRCGKPLQPDVICTHCGHTNVLPEKFCEQCGQPFVSAMTTQSTMTPHIAEKKPEPTSFAAGRYQVKKLLGEGGKKKVYLARDTVLDRDIAFAQIKTQKLVKRFHPRWRWPPREMRRYSQPWHWQEPGIQLEHMKWRKTWRGTFRTTL